MTRTEICNSGLCTDAAMKLPIAEPIMPPRLQNPWLPDIMYTPSSFSIVAVREFNEIAYDEPAAPNINRLIQSET
jgi:hypothetical protein